MIYSSLQTPAHAASTSTNTDTLIQPVSNIDIHFLYKLSLSGTCYLRPALKLIPQKLLRPHCAQPPRAHTLPPSTWYSSRRTVDYLSWSWSWGSISIEATPLTPLQAKSHFIKYVHNDPFHLWPTGWSCCLRQAFYCVSRWEGGLE